MGFMIGYLIGSDGDGVDYDGSLLISILTMAILYFTIQNFAVNTMGKYYNLLLVGYVMLTILIYRYSFNMYGFRVMIYIALISINVVVSVMISFIFFDKLGHDPLHTMINYLENINGWYINLVLFPVMIIDVYIRICFFRDIQKLLFMVLGVLIRLPIQKKHDELYAQNKKAEEDLKKYKIAYVDYSNPHELEKRFNKK